jgi:outer membrane autotransporter protein
VYGKITVSGDPNTNVVNLNFTGVDATTLKALNALLKAQGVSSGSDTPSVVFTLRGVTYDIDPAIVNGHLLSYQFQGLTPNQSAVGAALDTAKTNPVPGTPLFNLYNAIDQSGNVPGALEQLSPQTLQIYGDIALAISTFNTLEIDHRLNNLRDGSEGVDTSGMGGDNTMGLTSGLSKDDGKGGKKGVITPEREGNRWGFFASGHGIFTDISAHGGDLQDAGFTTGGMMLGVDGKINDRLVVGSFFNYDHTSADLDQRGSSANVDSYTGGLYTGYHNGGYYGNGLLSYTHNDYDSHRNIFLPGFVNTANGSTGGNQFTLNADGGYDFRLNDRLTWGPILGLQYVHMDVDSFNESGAPAANLAVGSQDMDSLRSRMGVRLEYNKQVGKRMAFATEVHAEWQHEFLDDSRGISGGFIGDGLAPFTVQTTSPERDAAIVGVGTNLTVRDKYTFFFDYDAQAGQASYIEQSVKGGVKISW